MVETLKANVEAEKTRILAFIGRTGPIVSNTIAKTLNLNSFLTSALLSELVNQKKLNASFIRVGGSALFYLDDQEEQLMRFTNFLGHKEKETYELLKKEGVLQDKQLHPAVRVAIRDVKDFAIPLKVSRGNEEILFWKFRFFNDADKKIKELLEELKPEKLEVQNAINSNKFLGTPRSQELQREAAKEPVKEEIIKEAKPKKKREKSASIEKVLEKWASENKVIVYELIFAKEKDAQAKVKVKTDIGEIDFLLVLKNKRIISEPDLAWAYQEGLGAKMPVIFLSPGKPSKQILEYMEKLGKGIVLRKL